MSQETIFGNSLSPFSLATSIYWASPMCQALHLVPTCHHGDPSAEQVSLLTGSQCLSKKPDEDNLAACLKVKICFSALERPRAWVESGIFINRSDTDTRSPPSPRCIGEPKAQDHPSPPSKMPHLQSQCHWASFAQTDAPTHPEAGAEGKLSRTAVS